MRVAPLRNLRLVFLLGWVFWPGIAPAQSPRFDLGLSVNDGAGTKVHPGWPLVVRLDVAPDEGAPAAPPFPASWQLKITNAQGVDQPWPLEQSVPPAQNSGDRARVTWVLAESASTALPPGMYTVQATGGGQSSPALAIEVAAAPASTDATARWRLAWLRSEVARLRNDLAAAERILEAALVAQPTVINLLSQLARVQAAAGKRTAALDTVEQALEQFEAQYPKAEHPPRFLLRLREEISATNPPPAGGR